MTGHVIRGQSPVSRSASAGEGPWWWDGFCGFVDIPGTSGDIVFVWTDASASITAGSGALNSVVTGSLYVLEFSATGTITITATTAGILAHRVTGTLNRTLCA